MTPRYLITYLYPNGLNLTLVHNDMFDGILDLPAMIKRGSSIPKEDCVVIKKIEITFES